jgi:hypothetical protein
MASQSRRGDVSPRWEKADSIPLKPDESPQPDE